MVLAGGFSLGTPCYSAWGVIDSACKVTAWSISTKVVLNSQSVNLVSEHTSPFQEMEPGEELDLPQHLLLQYLHLRFSSYSSFWISRVDVRYAVSTNKSEIREGTVKDKEWNFSTHHVVSKLDSGALDLHDLETNQWGWYELIILQI